MSHPHTCPRCSAPLPANAPAGLCPKCLMLAGLGNEPSHPPDNEFAATNSFSKGFVFPTADELAGRFPQLEIVELIGHGGMGAVYKARQPGLDRFVAVKILPPEVGRDAAFAERFAREARALARLSHPHIVAIHDSGRADDLYYLVMEFIDGTTLRDAMREGQLRPAEALAIVPQICDALQYAHDEGVVHRDIKPENILLDKRGRVKIADFGLSKLVAAGQPREAELSLTGSHQVMGTIRYMAPEQMEGAKAVDHRADIYSLGVVFYEMLTGELPLGRFAPPSQKVQVDVRLDDVVLRTLEREPVRRYQQARQVKTDVQSIVAEEPLTAESLSGEAKRRVTLPGDWPTAEAKGTADRVFPPIPYQYWIWTTGMWLAGWLFAAAMLNLGSAGVVLGAAVMLAIGCFVGSKALSYVRHQRPEVQGPGLVGRIVNVAIAAAMFVLGYLALIAAHYSAWQQPWVDRRGDAAHVEFRQLYQGREHHLVRQLSAFRSDPPRVELVAQGAYFEMHTYTIRFYFLIGVILLAGAAAIVLDDVRVRTSWLTYGVLTVAHLFALVAALGLANLLPSFTSLIQVQRLPDGGIFIGGGASATGVRREVACQTTSDEVASRVKAWMEAHGYKMAYRSEWQLDTVPEGKTVARVRIVGARKSDPFEAIQMTWRGPRRLTPILDIRSISSVTGAESLVTIDGGLARGGTGEAACWELVVQSLEQTLRSPPGAH